MTKASDNPFPSLLLVEGAAPATPAAGRQRLFVDAADGLLKLKDDTGTVTAIGSGGSSGGGGGTATLHTPPDVASAWDDEFTDLEDQSGPVNGLDAKWSRHNLAGAAINTDGAAIPGWLLFDVATGTNDQEIHQPIPAGDFHVAACATSLVMAGRQNWGLFVCDDAGNGYVVHVDNGDACRVRALSAWAQGGDAGSGSLSDVNSAFFGGSRVRFEIQRVGTTYTFSLTTSDFLSHEYRSKKSITTATAYTRIGFGRIWTDSGGATKVALDYFRVTEP